MMNNYEYVENFYYCLKMMTEEDPIDKSCS